MVFTFYICSFIAIFSTLRVVTHNHPVYALLHLIISLLAISGIFFSLGAYFAGAMECIIYAGAIMVLFVFVAIMLNLNGSEINQRYRLVKFKSCIVPGILMIILITMIVGPIFNSFKDRYIYNNIPVSIKEIGVTLFSAYMLGVELISTLLLSSLIIAFHIGQDRNDITTVRNHYFTIGSSSQQRKNQEKSEDYV